LSEGGKEKKGGEKAGNPHGLARGKGGGRFEIIYRREKKKRERRKRGEEFLSGPSLYQRGRTTARTDHIYNKRVRSFLQANVKRKKKKKSRRGRVPLRQLVIAQRERSRRALEWRGRKDRAALEEKGGGGLPFRKMLERKGGRLIRDRELKKGVT